MTTKEKELALNEKRFSIITESILKKEENCEKISHELVIYLHYAWIKTLNKLRGIR